MSVYDLNVLEWEIKNVVKLLLMREVVICNNIILWYFVLSYIFILLGELIEDIVRREVEEESGVKVGCVDYYFS